MKIVRKQTGYTQSKRGVQAYSEIFRLFHYRHEFARRNLAVTDAASTLAKNLGFKASRFETFIHEGRPLTDELYDAVTPSKHGKRREALRTYLDNHWVLPVTSNREGKTPYLAKEFFEMSDRHLQDWKLLFNSLMLFESLAMSDLGLGHPIFFPLMPLVVTPKDKAKSIKLGNLKLDDYDAPAFIDRSVPKQVLGYYSDALDLEVEDYRHKNPSKDERLGQATFDEYLDILDHHASLSRGVKGNAKIEYYKLFMPAGKKVNTSKEVDRALRWYDGKHLDACYYMDHYEELV